MDSFSVGDVVAGNAAAPSSSTPSSVAVYTLEDLGVISAGCIGTIGGGMYLDTPSRGECSLTVGQLKGKPTLASIMGGV